MKTPKTFTQHEIILALFEYSLRHTLTFVVRCEARLTPERLIALSALLALSDD